MHLCTRMFLRKVFAEGRSDTAMRPAVTSPVVVLDDSSTSSQASPDVVMSLGPFNFGLKRMWVCSGIFETASFEV